MDLDILMDFGSNFWNKVTIFHLCLTLFYIAGNYTFRAKSSAVLMDKLFNITKTVIWLKFSMDV